MSLMQIWDIPGGIHPPERKHLSTQTPIQPAPLPARLIVPLNQHIGVPAEPVVAVGDYVLKGQLIARANGFVSAAVHAPTSGSISFIGPQPYPHVSGMLAPAIVIDSDGKDQWCTLQPCADYRQLEPSALLELIRQAGISGMGGAGFPTAVKLTARPTQKIHTLVINGTECEPYITADDMLMREFAAELVSGIEILAHLINPEQVLIGIEDNKPEAIAAVKQAVGERPFQVCVFPTKYPSGGEKQLIQILTGVEVPSGGLPADIGMLCQNVGSAVAVHNAVVLGQPLISRITTLTGEALARPMNLEVLIGTPVCELLDFAGLDPQALNRLIMGGPMMGFTLPSTDAPIIKTSNCLLASSATELPAPEPAMPCIRCGECAEVCPASLLPQQLHFFALGQDHQQLKAHNLFDCIECGACAYVCPSSIPLVQYYRASKGEIRDLEQKQLKAEQSKQRFELRQERLRLAEEKKEAERKARLERAALAKAAHADSPTAELATHPVAATASGLNDELKKLKIQASMAQVALKKAEKQLAAHDTPELHNQVSNLRGAAQEAQKALDAALAAEPVAPAAKDAELKKAKIDTAMLRAQLRKLEKIEAPTAEQTSEQQQLRSQLDAAEKLLASLQTTAAAAPAKPAPAAKDAELKKAKIDAAMLRAQLRKLEKIEAPTAEQTSEQQQLRSQLEAAEKLLASLQTTAETAPAKPAPAAKDAELKKAKIELAMARAALKKAEKAEADASELNTLATALTAAEQALHAAEEASSKPAPQLQRIDKRPIDETSRTLKTEVAFARADLRKLERDENADVAALEAARSRLTAAEQALAAHQATAPTL